MPVPIFIDEIFRGLLTQRAEPLRTIGSHPNEISSGDGIPAIIQPVNAAAGQLQTGTLMDYTIPTAVELPRYEVEHYSTPSPFTPLGMKGVGESGVGSVLGALTSAVEDAFPDLDLQLTELPLTPNRVWRAIQDAQPIARP